MLKAQNTSYRWIAKKMEVSETTVSSMRKTGTEQRASDAFKIASALGTTVEYLCNGESDYYQSRYIKTSIDTFFAVCYILFIRGGIAQLVEQWTHIPCVIGSIPIATIELSTSVF